MTKLICLMPAYNKEDTLAKAIESVMMQKTDFDYKLIILDDCSTDNSNAIANDYKQKYPDKIDIVRNETNLKLLRSIMNGYKLLKGADYFCVLDADDWYTYEKKFSDAVKFLDKHKNYSMYCTNAVLKEEDKESLCYNGTKEIYDFDFSNRIVGNGIFMQTSGVIYRNIYFKTGKNAQFENIFNYKYPEIFRADGFRYEWYLHGGKAHFVNHPESVYNYDKNGLWSNLTLSEQNLCNARLMYSCSEFFDKEKMFYISYARRLYRSAISGFKNESDVIFLRNKDLITELGELLFEPQKTAFTKLYKFVISLIPSKRLRMKIKAFDLT